MLENWIPLLFTFYAEKKMEIFVLHKEDVFTPCVPTTTANFATVFVGTGGSGGGNLRRDRLYELSRMREYLVMACSHAASSLDVANPCAPEAGSVAASIPGNAEVLSQLRNSPYEDLTSCVPRLNLMRNYLVQWKALVTTLSFRTGLLKTRQLPQLSWRSGVDGRIYDSTCLAFETVMVGHMLAAQLYNVQQQLKELVRNRGYVAEDLEALFLARTAEAYRVLHEICTRELTLARTVLMAEAEQDNMEQVVLGSHAFRGKPGTASPSSLRRLPPECTLEFGLARMGMCVVRMHHLNCKRLMLNLLTRKTSLEKKENTLDEETLQRQSLHGMGWSHAQMRKASALDLALACQWTQGQLTAVHSFLARSGLVMGKEATTRLHGPGKGPSSQTLAPLWETVRAEAFTMKQTAVCLFLKECREMATRAAEEVVSGDEEETEARCHVAASYGEMYGCGQQRVLLSLFAAVVEMSSAEVDALCYGVGSQTLRQLETYRKSQYTLPSLDSLRQRLMMTQTPGKKTRKKAGSSRQKAAAMGLEDFSSVVSVTLPDQDEDVEAGGEGDYDDEDEEKAESDISLIDLMYPKGGSMDSAMDSRAFDASQKRTWVATSSDQLADTNWPKSALLGLLAARMERSLDGWKLSVERTIPFLDELKYRRLRAAVLGLHELFTGQAARRDLISLQFYGYREDTVMECLTRPYLPEWQAVFPSLVFAD